MHRTTKKIEKLSPRARTLWARVQNDTNRYPAYTGKDSPAMEELVKAGLVGIMGRVDKLSAYYVPKGTKPFVMERFPKVRP